MFSKPTYRVKVSIVVKSSALLTVESLVNTGPGSNLVNNDFVLADWKDFVKSIKSPQLRTENGEVLTIENMCTCSFVLPPMHSSLVGIVQNLAVNILLRFSFIDRGTRGIFLTERRIVSRL